MSHGWFSHYGLIRIPSDIYNYCVCMRSSGRTGTWFEEKRPNKVSESQCNINCYNGYYGCTNGCRCASLTGRDENFYRFTSQFNSINIFTSNLPVNRWSGKKSQFPSLLTGVCSQVPTWHQDWIPTTKCGGSHTMSVYEDDCKNVGTRGYCHKKNKWACNTSFFPGLKWFADECPRVCYHEWVNFPQWKLPSQEMC